GPSPLAIGRRAAKAARARRSELPGFDQAIVDGVAAAVVEAPGDADGAGRTFRYHVGATRPRQGNREERSDGLRGRPQRLLHGVASGPPRTMSNRNPSAVSGTVLSMSKRAMSRSRTAGSGIDWKIGSYSNSGSPGKYICVTRRWWNERPNTEK